MRAGNSVIGLAWMCLVNLLWATQFPAYAIAGRYIDVTGLNFLVFCAALMTLAPFWYAQQVRSSSRPRLSPIPEGRRSGWITQSGRFALLAGLGLLPPSLAMNWGIGHSSATAAAILTLSIPVMMLLMAKLLLGEPLTRSRAFSVVVALCGALLVSADDLLRGGGTPTVLGNAAILVACAGSAFYNIYSKRLLADHTEVELLVYGYLLAALVCGSIYFLGTQSPWRTLQRFPSDGWWAVLALGGITWGLSMVLFMWLLQRLDVVVVSISIYLLSFFGALLSALLLKESVRVAQLSGGALVLCAAIIADFYRPGDKSPCARASPGNVR